MSEIVYALLNNELKHVDEVENGLNCKCLCPFCGERLIARNAGKIQEHHFAHVSGAECQYGYETSLHLLAKKVLSTFDKIYLPKYEILNLEIYPEGNFNYIDVKLENKLQNIIPDVLVSDEKGNLLIIEIKVTHKVDELKLEKIKELDISTVEIDLSDFKGESIDEKLLTKIIFENNKYKSWLYNKKGNEVYNKIIEFSEKMPMILRGFATHIDYCPISSRTYAGKPYANLIDDCLYCEHFIKEVYEEEDNEEYGNGFILCSGKLKITSIEELDKIKDVKRVNDVIVETNKDNKKEKFIRSTITEYYTLEKLWNMNDEHELIVINESNTYLVKINVSPKEQLDFLNYCAGELYKVNEDGSIKSLGVREIFKADEKVWKLYKKN
jgi:hypothetical protein